MPTYWNNNKNRNLKNEPRIEFGWLCLLYHFCSFVFLFSFNTKLRVDGLIFATSPTKNIARFTFLLAVVLLLLSRWLLLLFLVATVCDNHNFFRIERNTKNRTRSRNEQNGKKKTWAKRRRFMFYGGVAWLVYEFFRFVSFHLVRQIAWPYSNNLKQL